MAMGEADYHSIAGLDRRLDCLSTEVAALKAQVEERERPSAAERFKAQAGVLALIISLITGGFTVYEKVFVEPQEDRAAVSAAVRGRLDDLSALSLQLQQAFIANPVAAQATLGAVAPKRFSLIGRAERDFAENSGDFLLTDLLLMGNETLNIGRTESAHRFAQRAMQVAVDPLEQANAKLLMARVLGATSPIRNIAEARRLQAAALDQARMTASPVAGSVQIGVLLDMFGLELSDRNCRAAQDVVNGTGRTLDQAGVPQSTRFQIQTNFRTAETNLGGDCRIDFAPIAP